MDIMEKMIIAGREIAKITNGNPRYETAEFRSFYWRLLSADSLAVVPLATILDRVLNFH